MRGDQPQGPLGGGDREVDHWFRTVTSVPTPERGEGTFRFDVPGRVTIDEAHVALSLPEVSVGIDLDGPLLPYFPAPDETASPFLGPSPSTPEHSHWFVHTLGTPARYRLDDHEGRGLLYAERGWSVRQAHGFCYLMAVSEAAKVVLTCGQPDDTTEVWAARVLTATHDLTFLPFAGAQEATSDVRPDEGRAEVTLTREDVTVRVASEAPPDAFYDQITPSLTVFHAEHPVAKTMQASLRLEIDDGDAVEVIELPQSILEFGGIRYPTSLAGERPIPGYTALGG